jgi:hypothetical protein
MPVAHIYNPSYLEGRDQGNHGLNPVWGSISRDLIMKKPNTKTGLMEWLKW